MKERIVLRNANLFDVERGTFRNNLDVLIEGDIIKEVGKVNLAVEESLKEIDCSQKYVLPGLFECHAHLTVLTNQPDEEKTAILKECGIEEGSQEEELERQVLEEFVKKGITQIRDCGGPLKTLKVLKDEISKGTYVGPDTFYAGPMLERSPLTAERNNKRWPGFTLAVDSKQDARRVIKEISDGGANLVKTFGKFDDDVLKYLLDEAKQHDLPVTHDPGRTFFHPISVDKGIDLGIRCFEHGKSLWRAVLTDDLKSEHDRLMDEERQAKEAFINKIFSIGIESISRKKLQQLAKKMADNDVYFCPTLHVFKHYAEHPEQFSEQEPDKFKRRFATLYKMARFITEEVGECGVKILVGQDGWSPIFTLDEMQELRQIDLSESEIMKGATIYPAEWLGVADRLGSISRNKKANIVLLNENPLQDIQNMTAAHTVVLNGKIAFQ